MKDEIKEILDKLKSNNYPFGIATIDINKLEDYITNLQTIEQQYSAILSENAELQEENQRLKELDENYPIEEQLEEALKENKRLKNGYCELKVKCNNGECDCTNEEYEGMVQANIRGSLLLDDYKSRCEKAIEYVKNDMPYLEEPDDDYENTHKMREYDKSILLNKLQGDDK